MQKFAKYFLLPSHFRAVSTVQLRITTPTKVAEDLSNTVIEVPKYEGYSFEEVKQKREKFISPAFKSCLTHQDNPFYNTRSRMQYIIDHNNNAFLDLTSHNCTISVGHNHPRIVDAIKRQMDLTIHSSVNYLNEAPVICAEKIVETMPKDFDWVVHFVNSGSEALDVGLMLARKYTGAFSVLSMRNAFHGTMSISMGLTALSNCKQMTPHGFGIVNCLNPDMYRGPFAGDPSAVKKYARDVHDAIHYSTSGRIAAFIFESVQTYGGVYKCPPGYLSQAATYVKDAGGLMIIDEIQTGLCRTGGSFWNFEEHGIVPDILISSKGLGNGMPIGAVVVKREIAESMVDRFIFSTYSGNPMTCAASAEVLRIISEEGILQHVDNVGSFLNECLMENKKKYPSFIGDVRGSGFLTGMDIVEDPVSKKPDTIAAKKLTQCMRNNGIISTAAGKSKNIIRVLPPLCATINDIKFFQEVFKFAIHEVYGDAV